MRYRFEDYRPVGVLSGHLRMGCAEGGPLRAERIEANSRFFMKNGVPTIDVMGEMHFSRVPRSEWSDRLRKMKAGGVTIVSTYLFWIYHEETEGCFDFTDNLDIRAFVCEAAALGLKTVLRIGPWAHGECRHGGFPDWLVAKGLRLRTNDPEYMRYVRIWYGNIYEQVKGLFHKDGGSIIGIQFDNELVNAPEHILALKQLALSIGFDAPLYTATGWNSRFGARLPIDEVIPVFGAYADAPWAKGICRRPPSPQFLFDPRRNDALVGSDVMEECERSEDGWRLPYERYPFALCELGAGIQSTYQRRTVISDMDAYALSLVKLGSGNNLIGYYMYAGGTNRIGALSTLQETRASGSPNDYPVRDYDFHTAITQYGEVSPRYGMLNLLHLFVHDFGEVLAPMEYTAPSEGEDNDGSICNAKVTDPCDGRKLRYCARTNGSSGFIFVNHHQRYQKLEANEDVRFCAPGMELPPLKVEGDVSFFLPVNMDLGGMRLSYALAQPLCRDGNRFFFVGIPGNRAVFRFEGQEEICVDTSEWVTDPKVRFVPKGMSVEDGAGHHIEICVLKFEEAVYLRRLKAPSTVYSHHGTGELTDSREHLLLGYGCDLYESESGLASVEGNMPVYADLSNEAETIGMPECDSTCTDIQRMTFLEEESISIGALSRLLDYPAQVKDEILAELHLKEQEQVCIRRIIPDGPEGFVRIEGSFDVAMIIADRKLAADKFGDGLTWRLPAGLMYGKEAYLITTSLKDDVFMDELT